MKQRLMMLLALVLCVHAGAQVKPAAPAGTSLAVVTDRPEALYNAGDKVRFKITLTQDGKPVDAAKVRYQLDKDGMPPVSKGEVEIKDGKGTVEGTLAEPGFLSCRLTYTVEPKKWVNATAGAGFEPTKLKPSMPAPDDFDAFWAQKKAQLRAAPAEPKLTSVPSGKAGIECYDLQIAVPGWRPVSAYFARPKDAKPHSLPAILSVHGAGVRSSGLGSAVGQASGFRALAIDLNANGIPNGKPDAYYKELSEKELKDYNKLGREDRETCYFLGMFLRLVRTMDYLTSLPEWDGKNLIVCGSSQGGGQSLAAAGLEPRVTLICAGVPAICDHSGKVIGRANGWPRLVPDVEGKPDQKILEVARYFDCVNFAMRAKAEAVLSVGFIDTTCAPSSVYAAYNALPGKKQIITEPLMGHAVSPKFGNAQYKAMQRQLKEHLQAKK